MNKFFLLAVVLLAAVASASRVSPRELASERNEQRGNFHVYKIKPKTHKHVEELLKPFNGYGQHPPIFLQQIRLQFSIIVLIEESKTTMFESFLRQHRIKYTGKGMSLVESISVHSPAKSPDCYPNGHRCEEIYLCCSNACYGGVCVPPYP